MDTKGHAVLSAALGTVVWGTTQSVPAAIATFSVGVFLDADHIVELYNWYGKNNRKRWYVILHSWEYFVLMACIYAFGFTHPILLGLIVGHGSHLISDSIVNNSVHKLGYFLTFRFANRFDISVLVPTKTDFSIENIYTRLPFGRHLIPVALNMTTTLVTLFRRIILYSKFL